MTFLKYNKAEAEKKANSFGAIADGEYELVVLEAEWRPMVDKPDKSPYFNLQLGIRSDVAQDHGGRKLFHSFFISRDPEKAEKSMGFINRFNFAINVPDGVEFETQEQWVKYIIGKPVKAKIKTEPSVKDGKTYENTNIKYFMETEFPDVAEQDKPQSKPNSSGPKVDDDPFAPGSTIDISDDDLPF